MARKRILYCGHRCLSACPTHGDLVREIIVGARLGTLERRDGVTVITVGKYLPIRYELTEKARDLLAWDRGEIWYPF